MLLVRSYPRETQEMVFDAHDRAFALFRGSCGRGIYDNMQTAVETLRWQGPALQSPLPANVQPLSGRASGLHAGVGLVRERFFTPRLQFKNLDELNA